MMRIDVHAHFTERSYYEDLATLPGVTVERHATGMSYLLRNGSKWLPFRDFMFDPDAQLRDMDRKGIDLRILSLSTPSVYLFETGRREEVCRRSNDLIVEQVRKAPVRFRVSVLGMSRSNICARVVPVVNSVSISQRMRVSITASRRRSSLRKSVTLRISTAIFRRRDLPSG